MGPRIEWQQQQFQMRDRTVVASCANAGYGRRHLLGYHRDDLLDLATRLCREQRGEALILQVAAEQRANPGTGDPKRVTGGCIVRKHEHVTEQFTYSVWLDIAALRRRRSGALLVP